MSKRILCLTLSLLMIISMLTVVPASAVTYLTTQLKVLPDVTTANAGDTINYTITMGPVSNFGVINMTLDIPKGFTYVENSFRFADGLVETLDFDIIEWLEEDKTAWGSATASDFNSDSTTILGYFQCTVDEAFCGNANVSLTNLEVFSCLTWDDWTERFVVVPVPVTVGSPAGIFEDATEIWFAGAEVNAEKPYVMQPMTNETMASEDPCIASASPTPADGQKLLATFDAEAGTLTFNSGYELLELEGTVEPEGGWNTYTTMQLMTGTNTKYGIKANGNLTIDLNGYTNGFWLDWNGLIKDVNTYGIYVEGDLTIKGDGYLRITASAPQDVNSDYAGSYTAYGIYTSGNVNFEDGMVYFFERPYIDPVAGDTATFVHAGGNINLNGGEVKMRGMKRSTWLTKFNKTPSYDTDYYYLPDVSNIEIEHAENQTLGFTRYVAGNSYNNTNNASYLIKRHTLSFDTVGGSEIPPVSKKIGEAVNLAEYVTTKSGYLFRGWCSDAAFTTPVSQIVMNEDKTIYAKWERGTFNYTLSFETYGATTIPQVTAVEGSAINLTVFQPVKDKYAFDGWYTEPEFVNKVTSVTLTGNTTVYAKWTRVYGTSEKVDEAPSPVAGTRAATEVWYAGVKLTNDIPYLYATTNPSQALSLKASASAAPPSGYSLFATFKNGVLTYARGFNSALGWNTYAEVQEVSDLSTEKIYGIHANGNLTIEMQNFNNFFYSNSITGYELPMEGVHVEGNLTINGGGILKLSVNPAMGGSGKQSYGIWAKGNVYINDTTVYMFSALKDYAEQSIKENNLTFIKAEKTVLDYGNIKLRAQHQATSPGIKRYETDIFVLQDGYTWDNCKKVNIIEPRVLGNAFETVTNPDWNNKNNLDLIPPTKNQILFGTAMLSSSKPYAVPNAENTSVSTYIASADPTDAVAKYDAVNNVLTILKSITIDSQKSIYKIDSNLESNVLWDIFPYTAIEAVHDLNIVIPKDVTVSLTSRPFGDNGVSRPIYSPGNITISGEGTLESYSNSAWAFMTYNEYNERIWHYKSAPIWAHGKLTISGITANLITNLDEPDGKSGHAIYGGQGIEIKDFASVCASTKLGKLMNVKPAIYEGATVMVAENGISGAGLPAATSALIPYDPEKVLDMKYIQIVSGDPATLTFETKGGSTIDPIPAAVGINFDLSYYTPTKDTYIFDGWYTDSALTNKVTTITLAGNTTLYAKWSNYCTLTFDVGVYATPIDPLTVSEGTVIDLLEYTNASYWQGHGIHGWYTDSSFTNSIRYITLTEDTVVYADWHRLYSTYIYTPTHTNDQGKVYSGDYELSGSTQIDTFYGRQLTLRAEPAEGYRFVRWDIGYSDSDIEASSTENPISFLTNQTSYYYAVFEKIPVPTTVGGTITGFLNAADRVTIKLISGSETLYQTTVTGNSSNFSFAEVTPGTYTMQISKPNHVTLEETITVSETAVTINPKIFPKGDVNNNGGITTIDFSMANSHAKEVSLLSGYKLKCADVIGTDGTVTTADAMRINSHAKEVSLLW